VYFPERELLVRAKAPRHFCSSRPRPVSAGYRDARRAVSRAMSDEPSEPSTILQRLQWRAVLLAFVVDYGGSKFFGLMAGIFAGIAYAKDGADAATIQQTLLASPHFLNGMLAMGLIFVVIGGYVAASLAPRAPYLNAAALGVVDVVLGFTAFFDGLPAWYLAIAFPATPLCALFGAFIASLLAGRESEE